MKRSSFSFITIMLLFQSLTSQSWGKKFFENTGGSEHLERISQTTDGNYVMAGYHFDNVNGGNIFYSKITPEGKVEWVLDFGSAGTYEAARDIISTPDGGFIILSNRNGKLDLIYFIEQGVGVELVNFKENYRNLAKGIEVLANGDYLIYGFSDINPDIEINEYEQFLLRVTSTGEVVYDITVPFEKIQYDLAIEILDNKEVYISSFTSPSELVDPPEMILSKWDLATGEFLWKKNMGPGILTDMIVKNDKQGIIGASTTVNINQGKTCKLLDIDQEGNILEEFLISNSLPCETKNLIELDDDRKLLSVLEYNNIGITTSFYTLDSTFDELCKISFSDNQQTTPVDLILTSEDKILLLCHILEETGNGQYNQFPLLISLDDPCETPDILSTLDNSSIPKIAIKISPIPFTDILNIDTAISTSSIQLYSALGNHIEHIDIGNRSINLAHLETGTYFLRFITTDHQAITKKIIKVGGNQ
jgi:hypothetical protein